MAIAAGTKLGPYELTGLIGAGGMGEVYRAYDARLARHVAVKILPAMFSLDTSRLRRFEQEARAAAGLNHPNILAVYDIGQQDGAPYIVSELLDGESLREKLRAGPIAARKAIDYALQTALGLAAAHDKGIVHRDLKPENVFITVDGRVKILDFGLAKLTRAEGDAAGTDATRTVHSDAGTVVGTMGYMSPEQVRGKPVDARSDLFSLGAILYEMVSGRRAFTGDTAADTITAILTKEPPELASSPDNIVPPALDRIVRHCLEKSPAERFQSAHDIAFDLQLVSGVSVSSSAVPIPAPVQRRRWLIPAVAAALTVLAVAVGFWLGRQGTKPNTAEFHRLTYRRGTVREARFAPDGQTVVYGGEWNGQRVELFTARVDSIESRPLALGPAQILSISKQGEMAIKLAPRETATWAAAGTLARLPLTGGAPRELMEDVSWADWDAEGKEIAVVHELLLSTGGSLNQLEYPIGKVLVQPDGWVSHLRFSPAGDQIAYMEHIRGGDDGWVCVVDLAGHHRRLTAQFSSVEGLAWSPNGKEVWFTGSKTGADRWLYAIDFAGHERLLTRAPGALLLQDIARDGRVLATVGQANIGVNAIAPGDSAERDLSWFDWSIVQGISSDGRTIVFTEGGDAVGQNWAVFLRKTDGSPAIRLGDGGGGSALSPDGKSVLVNDRSTPAQLWLLPTGAGQPRQLTHDSFDHGRVAWLHDHRSFIFAAAEPGRPRRVFLSDVQGTKPRPITPEGVLGMAVSADDKYVIAYRERLPWLYPLAGGDAVPIRGVQQDESAIWGPDTRSVYVFKTTEMPVNIYRLDVASGKRQLWKALRPSDSAGVLNVLTLAITPDGQAYAYSFFRDLSTLYTLDGLH